MRRIVFFSKERSAQTRRIVVGYAPPPPHVLLSNAGNLRRPCDAVKPNR
jgi:hypothetical protein